MLLLLLLILQYVLNSRCSNFKQTAFDYHIVMIYYLLLKVTVLFSCVCVLTLLVVVCLWLDRERIPAHKLPQYDELQGLEHHHVLHLLN